MKKCHQFISFALSTGTGEDLFVCFFTLINYLYVYFSNDSPVFMDI